MAKRSRSKGGRRSGRKRKTAAAMARWRSRDARGAKLATIEVPEPMLLFLIHGEFLSEADADDKKKIGNAVERFHDFALKSDRITESARRT